ncbi:hypothetical protein [Methylobacterium sp. GC_Met_2]|uniref:hypothetical protein n=1 Tax=Methylobacterium sp. GC_Met_2 TaxID=2937376 RepID=UPI00226B1C79|nr:hypothetical protein [Methylobacterium sp. GC_Met_2]
MSGAEFRTYKVALAACAFAWALLLAFLAGPLVVATAFPVRVDLRADRIERTRERLCWDASGIKVREGSSDDLDVFLYAGGIAGRMVVAVYGEANGIPWRRVGASKIGPFRKRYCVDLDTIPASAPVRLEMTVYYHEAFGMLRVPQRMPDVSAPGL